jgi:plasmid stabilization system protein ParE
VDIRELVAPPYRLIYRVRSEAVEIVAIVHGRQELPSHLPRR